MPALIPIAISLVPALAQWIFGDKGGTVAAKVAGIVETVAGTSDPAAAARALANPEAAAQLQVQLSQILAEQQTIARQADLDEVKAHLADVAGARSQLASFVSAGSLLTWAPVVVSVCTLLTFAAVMVLALTSAMPPGSETIVTLLFGASITMAGQVVNFWLGSSSGSERKTTLLAMSPGINAQQGGPN